MVEQGELLPVIQDDREAAEQFYRYVQSSKGARHTASWVERTAAELLAGKWDREESVQCFTRHRLRHSTAKVDGEPYPADNWREQGYTSSEAEIDDMARVGRALVERIAEITKPGGDMAGWMPADCPSEIVIDMANLLHDTRHSTDFERGLEAGAKVAEEAVERARQATNPFARECGKAIAAAIRALAPADGWLDIAGAPRDKPIRLRVTYEFTAEWRGCLLNSDGKDCGGWHAIEGDIPPCWTDDICWESNEDGDPSASPDAWQPLPAPPGEAK